MSGPVGPTRGERFSGGYQFARTHHSRVTRGETIRVERLGDGAYAQIVKLAGSPLVRFEISGAWTTRGADGNALHVEHAGYARDQLEATSLFVQLVRTIIRERGGRPDATA